MEASNLIKIISPFLSFTNMSCLGRIEETLITGHMPVTMKIPQTGLKLQNKSIKINIRVVELQFYFLI